MRDREALIGTTSQASEVLASSEPASAIGRVQGGRTVESRLSVLYGQMQFHLPGALLYLAAAIGSSWGRGRTKFLATIHTEFPGSGDSLDQ